MEATAWIALVALAFTGTQAWIARRKLQFDLFAKRYEVWDAFNDAVEARRAVYAAMRPENVEESDGGEAFRQFFRLRRQMVLLFPPEVEDGINAINVALQALAIAAVARERPAVPSPEAAKLAIAQMQAFSDANMKIHQLQENLMWLVGPYLRQYGRWEVYGVPAIRRLRVKLRQALRPRRGR